MHLAKRCGFALVYTVPALLPVSALLGAWTGRIDLFAWLPLAVLFGLVPIADYALGRDSSNPTLEQAARLEADVGLRLLTLLALPVHLGVLAWSAWHFADTPFGALGQIGWLLAQGVVGGVLAINTAHELIHKDSRLERAFGGALLASVGYHGFKVEHLRGHHVHVATPDDASSARMGQTVWGFVPQALWRNTRRAWQLEAQRLARLGLPAWHPRNELIGWTALYLAFATAFALWLGTTGLVFFVAQGVIAAVSLEIINYIEHYGLERARLPDGRYERTTHLHSWNSDYRLSNWLLFHLQHHSDHHAVPRRRYAALRHHDDSPQLPGGYGAMFVLALVPPLWFRIVHPVLVRWRATR